MIPDAAWAAIVGLLGLAIGSFLNVLIYRVPANESIMHPPSRCPSCGASVRNRHNVPVVGWLMLRGRCYDCKAPISVRYPIIELVTGLLFAGMTLRMLHLDLAAALPAYLYFAAIGIALAMIDIDVKRLPNTIVLPSYGVISLLLLIATIKSGDWAALVRAGIGAGGLFLLYFLLASIYPAGMGFGDVKLAFILGAVLTYISGTTLVVGSFLGFLLGSVGGIALLVARRGTRKSLIPFGPYMIAGALVGTFVAQPIWNAYLRAAGRS